MLRLHAGNAQAPAPAPASALTVTETAQGVPDLSTLVAALVKAGLAGTSDCLAERKSYVSGPRLVTSRDGLRGAFSMAGGTGDLARHATRPS